MVERLQAFDNAAKTYSYSILQAPFPATEYLATIKVEAQGDGARVTWSGRFEPVGVTDE
ncbi:Polyketide cyclase / dehydrase and lipid transport [compost metagenome]